MAAENFWYIKDIKFWWIVKSIQKNVTSAPIKALKCDFSALLGNNDRPTDEPTERLKDQNRRI